MQGRGKCRPAAVRPNGTSVQPQQIAEGEPLPPGEGLVHRLCRGAGGAEHRVPLLGGEGVGAEFGLLGQLPGPGGRLCSPAGQPLKIEIGRDGRPVGVFILETPLPAAAGPKAPQGEGQRQQKGGQEGRKQAERELRALIREGRRRRGGGCRRGGVGGAAGLGRGRGRGGGLGLLRAALGGSAPGVDGGDLHRLPQLHLHLDFLQDLLKY